MIGLLSLLHTLLTAPFKSRRRLGQSGASVWTTSSSWVRCICAGSFGPMLAIIMTSEHIGRWVRMRRLFVRFSGQGVSSHTRSLADFITTTCASKVFGTHNHFVVLGEAHLRRILQAYAPYYNDVRTHRSLAKDAPVSRPVQRSGLIKSYAILGGLHHHYARV